MTTAIHVDMHRDHIVWKAEFGQWRDDLDLWKKELALAESQLLDMEKALKSHRDALAAHTASVIKREQSANRHESEIAAYEMGEPGAELPAMAVQHNSEAQEQTAQRHAHERIRRHHHAIIANCNLLVKAIQQPM